MSTTQTTTQTKRPAGAKLAAKRERVDATLREALSLHTDSIERWAKLKSSGATDTEIWHALKREFGGGGSSQTEGGVQFAFKGGDTFNAPPQFFVDCGTPYADVKPTLSGAALVKRVREVLEIPPFDAEKLDTKGRVSPPASSGDDEEPTAPDGDDGSRETRLNVAAVEAEQRGRWAVICEIASRKRQSKKSSAEFSRLSEEYDAVYSEVADKLGSDVSLHVRARVEDGDDDSTLAAPEDAGSRDADGDAPGDTAAESGVVETPAQDATPVINADALLSKMTFPVPDDKTFEFEEFIDAPELAEVAQELLHRFEEFSFLYDFNLKFLWRKKGGASGSKNTLGKCQKPTGLLKKYADASFIIWVAADHTRARLNSRQMEALLYHELMHASRDEKGRPAIRPHDFEGFAREIEIYGAWKGDIERIGRAFETHAEQGNLF